MYRGLTRVAVDQGAPFVAAAIIEAASHRGLGYRVEGGAATPWLDGAPAESRIRGEDVTAAVSEISAIPSIRDWVNERLRALAAPDRVLVLDGRDIGTAVFPDAAVKVYLVAAPAVRAERRLRQRGEAVETARLREETDRIAARDAADSARAVAPLRPAVDAVRIDTSGLSFEAQVDRIVDLVRARGI
jgi:cytidylate kinase